MPSTNFINYTTPVEAAWLNEVNDVVHGIPDSGNTNKGAGSVAYAGTLPYSPGTVGFALDSLAEAVAAGGGGGGGGGSGVPQGPVLPPDNISGNLFYNTTDGKLYRYFSGAWTVAVPTVDLVGVVEGVQLADGSITSIKVTDGAITSTKILDNAVVSGKILAGAVVADKIATNAVTSDKIEANAITSDKIIANAITAGKIAAATITTDKLFANAATAASAAAVSTTSVGFTSVSGLSTLNTAVVSLATTGAPVKVVGYIAILVNVTAGNPSHLFFDYNIARDGFILDGGIFPIIVPFLGSSTNRQAAFQVPILARETPGAGTHTWEFAVSMNFYNSTGGAVSCTGNWGRYCKILVEENKV